MSDLGKYGEELAQEYLMEQGLRILETNYRFHHAEVDIVAEEGDLLVFCEVKTRHDDSFGAPEQAITPYKAQQIRKVASAYLAKKQIRDRQCRFDVIGVMVTGAAVRLNHMRNAFW
jgi:putative endonuclease